MKKTFLILALFFATPAFAEETQPTPTAPQTPVMSAGCVMGGDFGYEISFAFGHNINPLKVTIKRVKKDFFRDLTEFDNNHYRLDVAPEGGIRGYILEYRNAENGELITFEQPLKCGVTKKETQEKNSEEEAFADNVFETEENQSAEKVAGNDLESEEIFDNDESNLEGK